MPTSSINFKDMTEQVFCRLTALQRAANDSRGETKWHCRCNCGAKIIVRAAKLRSGHTRSCGCLQVEITRKRSTRHGDARRGAKVRTYKKWKGMLGRCLNPNTRNWHRYGGRGIIVCSRWHQYQNFLLDMGKAPAGLSIDRIDNDGNYEPGNCRWATRKEQARNTRTTRRVIYNGRTMSLAEAVENHGVVKYGEVHQRLDRGWSIERALTTPIKTIRNHRP